MERSREIRIALLLLVIFLGGGGAGFFLRSRFVTEENAIRRGPRLSQAEREERLFSELNDSLKLTEEQRNRIRQQIADGGKERIAVNRRRLEDRLQSFEHLAGNIRTNLTQQQQQIFDQRVRQVRRLFRRMIDRESTQP